MFIEALVGGQVYLVAGSNRLLCTPDDAGGMGWDTMAAGTIDGPGGVPRALLVAAVPAVAVLFDYSMTLHFSGSAEALLALEYSPLVRLAVAHGVVPLYLLSMMAAYFAASAVVIRVFRGTALLPFGYAVILMVSINHVLGGFSWVVRDALYSSLVIALSCGPLILGATALAYLLLFPQAAAGR